MDTATAPRRRIALGWISCLGWLLAVPLTAQTSFTDATREIGVELAFTSRSIAFGDYDNDGRPDLFCAENFRFKRIALLHNEGNGRFVDRTDAIQADIPPQDKGGGAIFGDYDNDGDLDLFVPVGAWQSENRALNVLLRNDEGIFTDVTLEAGLEDRLPTDNAIWLDYDRDGHIDLYTGNPAIESGTGSLKDWEGDPTVRSKLHRNNGDGTFADVTEQVGLDMAFHPKFGGFSEGLVAGDFNDDGWPDLYVAVGQAPNRLFLNDGHGRFEDATTSEIGDPGDAFGVAVGDIDNDGDLDIFQAAGGTTSISGQRSLMLMNLGKGIFIDVTDAVGLSQMMTNCANPVLADIDNDGDLDLVIAKGKDVERPSDSRGLFMNNGDGTFTTPPSLYGLSPYDGGGGYLSVGDYTGNGFLDIWFERSVSRNHGNDNHGLRVELVGLASNRNGIGARLVATSGDLQQMREILGGNGYNQDEMVAHFGLGERTQVDQLEIRWPSGQVDVLTDIPADQKIRVIEGQSTYHPVEPTAWITPLPSILIAGAANPVSAVLRPALFESQAQISRVTADLSELGGPDSVPLREVGDGTYRLEVELTPDPGVKELSLSIEQITAAGSRWVKWVEEAVVFPGGDVPIWDGEPEGWQVESSGRVENLDLTHRSEVYRGDVAAAIQVKKTFSPWKVAFRPNRPVPRQGFRVLRFAFHPGDVTLETGASLSVALAPGKATDLLDRVDVERREWQVVEIPLSATTQDEPIEAVSFAGTFAGTFFLDAIELIATVLPQADLPVFAEGLHDGWTVRPEWLLNLTRHPAGDSFPDWSPDGQRVTFESNRDGNYEIYVVGADGSNPVNLTNDLGYDGVPSWSPDGSRIAFCSSRDGNDEIYVMNADGSNPVNLTNDPG